MADSKWMQEFLNCQVQQWKPNSNLEDGNAATFNKTDAHILECCVTVVDNGQALGK